MRIEYENNFKDILLFNAIHQFLSPVLQVVFLLLPIFIVFAELNAEKSNLGAAVLSGIFWYFGLWIFQFIFNSIYLYSRKNKSVLTNHIIEIQDEALYEETKYNRSYFFWNGIVKIVRRPGFIAVYVTPHMAHIIPNRAFTSSQQVSCFVDDVKSRIINV